MVEAALIGAVSAVVWVPLMFALFSVSRNWWTAQLHPKSGEVVLRYTPFLVWTMGGIAVLAPLGLAVLALTVGFEDPDDVYIPLVLGPLFLLWGGTLAYWLAVRRTRVGPIGLVSEYAMRKPVMLPWEEVEQITFTGQDLWLIGRRNRALLSSWFVGVRDAEPLLYQHLSEEVLNSNGGAIERFGRALGRR